MKNAVTEHFSRRATLGLLASGLAVAATGCYRRQSAPLKKGSRVVVVGAGAAGLAATEWLLNAGFKVDLIEAAERIGGRVRTEELGDQHVDLGGIWLHDGTTNFLRGTAEAKAIKLHRTNWNNGITLSNNQPIKFDTKETIGAFEGGLRNEWLSYSIRNALGLSTQSDSLEKAAGEILNSSGAQGCSLRALLETNHAAPLDQVSASSMFGPTWPGDDGHDPLPTNDVVTQNGMSSLLKSLTLKAWRQVSLNEPVDAIARTTDGVQIKTNRRTIDADAVIVTVSAGVLKSGVIDFSPGLPSTHKAALDNIKMGVSDKLYMLFPDNVELPGSHILTLCDEGPFGIVVNFQAIAGRPLIVGMTSGSEALNYRQMPKEAAASMLHKKLELAYQRKLPPPLAIKASDWVGDPWIRGAYAYRTVAADGSETEKLRKPIAERIFFAGEAIADRMGLVDGAWRDGRRAAEAVAFGA